MNGHETADEKLKIVILDIRKYMIYLGVVGMGGSFEIKHLPMEKSIDNHPYWLITKLKYIKDRLNVAGQERKSK